MPPPSTREIPAVAAEKANTVLRGPANHPQSVFTVFWDNFSRQFRCPRCDQRFEDSGSGLLAFVNPRVGTAPVAYARCHVCSSLELCSVEDSPGIGRHFRLIPGSEMCVCWNPVVGQKWYGWSMNQELREAVYNAAPWVVRNLPSAAIMAALTNEPYYFAPKAVSEKPGSLPSFDGPPKVRRHDRYEWTVQKAGLQAQQSLVLGREITPEKVAALQPAAQNQAAFSIPFATLPNALFIRSSPRPNPRATYFCQECGWEQKAGFLAESRHFQTLDGGIVRALCRTCEEPRNFHASPADQPQADPGDETPPLHVPQLKGTWENHFGCLEDPWTKLRITETVEHLKGIPAQVAPDDEPAAKALEAVNDWAQAVTVRESVRQAADHLAGMSPAGMDLALRYLRAEHRDFAVMVEYELGRRAAIDAIQAQPLTAEFWGVSPLAAVFKYVAVIGHPAFKLLGEPWNANVPETLTPADGQALLRLLVEAMEDINRRVKAGLSPEQQSVLQSSLGLKAIGLDYHREAQRMMEEQQRVQAQMRAELEKEISQATGNPAR